MAIVQQSVDRNHRARILFLAEALDRRTHLPGQHGGVLKRSGLAVLRALLFGFFNAVTERCDPGYDALARAAGVARSTVAVALGRLEQAGILERVRRQSGAVRFTNAYRFRASASETAWSESRPQTTTLTLNNLTARGVPAPAGPVSDRARRLLDVLAARERRMGLKLVE